MNEKLKQGRGAAQVYETEQYYFMFMEPCRGGELFHVIVSQCDPLPPTSTAAKGSSDPHAPLPVTDRVWLLL